MRYQKRGRTYGELINNSPKHFSLNFNIMSVDETDLTTYVA